MTSPSHATHASDAAVPADVLGTARNDAHAPTRRTWRQRLHGNGYIRLIAVVILGLVGGVLSGGLGAWGVLTHGDKDGSTKDLILDPLGQVGMEAREGAQVTLDGPEQCHTGQDVLLKASSPPGHATRARVRPDGAAAVWLLYDAAGHVQVVWVQPRQTGPIRVDLLAFRVAKNTPSWGVATHELRVGDPAPTPTPDPPPHPDDPTEGFLGLSKWVRDQFVLANQQLTRDDALVCAAEFRRVAQAAKAGRFDNDPDPVNTMLRQVGMAIRDALNNRYATCRALLLAPLAEHLTRLRDSKQLAEDVESTRKMLEAIADGLGNV